MCAIRDPGQEYACGRRRHASMENARRRGGPRSTSSREAERSGSAAGGEAARVIALQRSIGNRRTTALLTGRPQVLARRGGMNATWGTIEDATFAGVRSRFADAIDPDIASAGQFQFTLLIAAQVRPVFDAIASEKWADEGERTGALELWNAFAEQLFGANYKKADETRKALSEWIRTAQSPEAKKLVPHLGSDAESGYGAAAKVFQEHWKSGKGKPDVSKRLTLAHLFAFRRWEAQACKATATYAARRLPGSGKWGGNRSAATSIPETVLTTKRTRDLKERAIREWVGDVFTYRDDLPSIVGKMTRALDDGWTIHVRVLSGSVGTDEEHSVLVIGHHDARTFFFFDPDVGGSDLANLGYGRFYFNQADNLLTTARDRSDLTVWSADVGPDVGGFEGWHVSSGRHRYQAMRLWTE
jgi:hypothetical protein